MLFAYVDCVACGFLIRSVEPSCPFCGSRRLSSVSSSWPVLGLVIGLGLASVSCTGGEGDTISESQEADAVTYGGPDTLDGGPWPTTTTGTTTNDSLDTQEADATTYAGPDETTSIGDPTTTTVGTTEVTTASSEDTATTDSGEPCVPITEDASAIGLECEIDADCPAGYTCQPFAGIVLSTQCEILCEQTCECPAGLSCTEITDKGGATWHQCT